MSEVVTSANTAATIKAGPQVSEWKRFRRVFFQNRVVMFACTILALTIIMAIFAPFIAPHSPAAQNLAASLQGPSDEYPLGTDILGMCLMSRLVYGSRTALLAGLITVGLSAAIGIILGVSAGYFGGIISSVIMRFMDALMGFPMLILALMLAAVLGGGLQNIIIALTVASVPGYVRVMNAMTLSVKYTDYIMAQHALGASSFRTVFRHIIPNAVQPMVIMVTAAVGGVILAEAGLSFLGIGIRPPGVAWGSMVADGYRFLATHPRLSFAPGIAIMLVVFSFNIIGDSLRDAMDPRLRGLL